MEKMISKLESAFEAWLKEFEEKPIRTGLKAVVVLLIVRWIWRNFK